MMEDIFRRFRKIDFLAIAVLAVAWALVTWLISSSDSQLAFFALIFVTAVFAAFTALLVGKLFSVTLFYLVGAAITVPISNLGYLGFYKIPVLFLAGIVFEAFFLLLKIKIRNIPADVILGTAFSNFSIAFAMLLFISSPEGLIKYAWNFAVTLFILGIMGSVIAFLAWYNIKGLRPVIRFKYRV